MNLIIIALSSLGFWKAGSLSLDQWTTPGACPCFGIPACYLVTVAYLMIVVSCANHQHRISRILFFSGSGVVTGLAIMGSTLQVLQIQDCPSTNTGIPMCYLSLMMGVSILTAFFIKDLRSQKAIT